MPSFRDVVILAGFFVVQWFVIVLPKSCYLGAMEAFEWIMEYSRNDSFRNLQFLVQNSIYNTTFEFAEETQLYWTQFFLPSALHMLAAVLFSCALCLLSITTDLDISSIDPSPPPEDQRSNSPSPAASSETPPEVNQMEKELDRKREDIAMLNFELDAERCKTKQAVVERDEWQDSFVTANEEATVLYNRLKFCADCVQLRVLEDNNSYLCRRLVESQQQHARLIESQKQQRIPAMPVNSWQIRALRQFIKEKENRIQDVRSCLDAKDNHIRRLRSEKEESLKKNVCVEQELSAKIQKIDDLAKKVKELKEANCLIMFSEKILSERENQIKALEKQIGSEKKEVETKKRQIDDLEQRLRDAETTAHASGQTTSNLSNNLQKAQSGCKDLEQALNRCREEAVAKDQSHKKNIQDYESNLTITNNNLTNANQQVGHLESRLAILNSYSGGVQSGITGLQERLRDLEQKAHLDQQEISGLRQKATNLEEVLKTRDETVRKAHFISMSHDNQAFKRELEIAKTKMLDGEASKLKQLADEQKDLQTREMELREREHEFKAKAQRALSPGQVNWESDIMKAQNEAKKHWKFAAGFKKDLTKEIEQRTKLEKIVHDLTEKVKQLNTTAERGVNLAHQRETQTLKAMISKLEKENLARRPATNEQSSTKPSQFPVSGGDADGAGPVDDSKGEGKRTAGDAGHEDGRESWEKKVREK